jgi:2-haloacid dehalogenase
MTAMSGIRVCVFDAYGTLFDVHAAAAALREEIGSEAPRLSAGWRTRQLEYTWLLSLMGVYKPFWEITQDALDVTLEECGLTGQPDLRQKLLDLYFRLSAYPEVPGVLADLKAAGLQTAILSNGSMDMLDWAVDSAGIRGHLDDVLSVEDVGIFKPDPRIYQMVMDRFRLGRRDAVAFLSSNAWDAAGAAHFGFQTLWVNRAGAPRERLPGTPKAEIADLSGLPGLVGVKGSPA